MSNGTSVPGVPVTSTTTPGTPIVMPEWGRSVEKAVAEEVKKIPANRGLQAGVNLSAQGVEFGGAIRKDTRWGTLTAGGYALRQWGTAGWTGGARASIVW